MLCLFMVCGVLLHGQYAIVVQERDGIARTGEPVTLGMPFARGTLSATAPFRIVDGGGDTQDAQFQVMALWDDGSVKWLKCHFQADVPAGSTAVYNLRTDTQATPATELSVSETAAAITVTTGPLRFTVNKTQFNISLF